MELPEVVESRALRRTWMLQTRRTWMVKTWASGSRGLVEGQTLRLRLKSRSTSGIMLTIDHGARTAVQGFRYPGSIASALREEPLGPTISLDYAFMHEGEEEEGIDSVLVAVDQIKHSVWALQVDRKGVDTGAGVEWLVGRLKPSGYDGVKVTLRIDQEKSLLAFEDAVVMRRKAETSLVDSPVRESKSNGLVERAIRSWRETSTEVCGISLIRG